MAWTNIANANLDIGAPIRSVDILALRDNVSAVPNGDTNAPRIKAQALNGGQSGNAPIYAARAWISFNGTGTFSPNPSTSAIRGSGNVSSVTKTGTGDFTVNFSTAMPDNNYCVGSTGGYGSNVSAGAVVEAHFTSPKSTTSFRIRCIGADGNPNTANFTQTDCVFFR
jgi:hypothetical protein